MLLDFSKGVYKFLIFLGCKLKDIKISIEFQLFFQGYLIEEFLHVATAWLNSKHIVGLYRYEGNYNTVRLCITNFFS